MDYLTKRTKIRWDFGISEVSKVVVTLLTCGLIIASIAFFEMYYYSITNEGEEVTKAIYEGFDKAIFATAIFLLTCMPFIIANFINNCINYIQEKKRTIDLLAHEKKDTEYKAIELDNLMARMNPHFLFNGLNSIASLASIDTDKTEKMAISLADFYKYASNRENKFISTIKEELELLDSYIAVEQIRYGNKLSVSKTIGESVMDYKIPFMILQPLVENAVKYGYSAEPDQICIDIQVYKSDEYINILIFDKGKPFSDEMQTGFGLHSISRKLTIIYGDRFELKMINEPFKHVFLRIPNSVSL